MAGPHPWVYKKPGPTQAETQQEKLKKNSGCYISGAQTEAAQVVVCPGSRSVSLDCGPGLVIDVVKATVARDYKTNRQCKKRNLNGPSVSCKLEQNYAR